MSRAIPVPSKAKKKAPPPPRLQMAMPLISIDEPQQERPQKLSTPLQSQQASPSIPEPTTSPTAIETPIEPHKQQPSPPEPQIVEVVAEIPSVPSGIRKPPVKKPGPPPPRTKKPVPPPGFKPIVVQEITQQQQIKPQSEQNTDQKESQIKTEVAQPPFQNIQTEQAQQQREQPIKQEVKIEPINFQLELGPQIGENSNQSTQIDTPVEIKLQAHPKPPPAPPKAARKPKGPPPPSKIKPPAPSSPKHVPSPAIPNIQELKKEPQAAVQQHPATIVQKPVQIIPQPAVPKIENISVSKPTIEGPIKEVIKPKVPPPMTKVERPITAPVPIPTLSKIENQPVVPQSTPSKSKISAKLQELRKAKQQMLLDASFLEEENDQQNQESDFVKEEQQPQPQKLAELVLPPSFFEAPVQAKQEKPPIELSKPVFDAPPPIKANPIAPPKASTRAPPAPGKRMAPPPPTIKNPPKLPQIKVEAVQVKQAPEELPIHPVQAPQSVEEQIQQSPLKLPSPAEPPKVLAEDQAPPHPIQKEKREKTQQLIVVKGATNKDEGQDRLNKLLQRYHSIKTGYLNNLRQLDELIHFQKQEQDNQIQKINHLLADLHRKNDAIKQICSIQELHMASEQEEIAI